MILKEMKMISDRFKIIKIELTVLQKENDLQLVLEETFG